MKHILTITIVLLMAGYCIGQSTIPDFVEGEVFVRASIDKPSAISEYDSTFTDYCYSSIPNFDSIKQVANIFKIERAFHEFKDENDNLFRTFKVHFSESYPADSLVSFYMSSNMVDNAEKIPVYSLHLSANDPDYDPITQWNLFKVAAENAWGLTEGKKTVRVAIVDDAVRINHEDLKNKIYVNQGEIPPGLSVIQLNLDGIIDIEELMFTFQITNDIDSLYLEPTLFDGLDNDGNLCPDDLFGWDAANWDEYPHPPSSASSTHFTHGTHVAGITAAETTPTGNSGLGIASIGRNISILPVKCKHDSSMSTGSLEAPILGVKYAILQNVDIINMSWGAPSYNTALHELMITAKNKGILLVASAGNDGDSMNLASLNHYPAAYDEVISVGSSDSTDLRSSFSCYGNDTSKWVDIMAPGSGIYSCLANAPDSYGYKNGTSMASPLVAGLLGLMKSYCPQCTDEVIDSCLMNTCDSMPNEILYSTSLDTSKVGHGRINAFEAISCLTYAEPVASFSTTLEFLCAGNSMGLVDESTGFITSWEWYSPNGFVSFSSTTAQNPNINVGGSNGDSYSISLVVTNDSTGISDTATQVFTLTEPEATIIFPTTITDHCNNNSNYFIVEFASANPPYSLTYSDNHGHMFTENNIMENPYLISVEPENDDTTHYYLNTMYATPGCFAYLSDTATFVSEPCDCYSLYRNNHWTFGLDAAIQFEATVQSPSAGTYAIPTASDFNGKEGPSSVSDFEGNILFSCDAINIYDRNFNIMENGNNIEGSTTASQATMILPKSIADSTYYLLSVGDGHGINPGLWMNVVDMKYPGNGGTATQPNGRVLYSHKNIPLPTNGIDVGEKMTWVKHNNMMNSYWVVTHSTQENIFLVYLATPDTITLERVDTIPNSSNVSFVQGQLKANLKGDKLAAAYILPPCIELYGFDNQTGDITLHQSVPTYTDAFGIEFSPNGGMLYFTYPGSNPGTIGRYMVFGNTLSNYSEIIIPNSQSWLHGLQLTPDHKQILVGEHMTNNIRGLVQPDISNPGLTQNVFTTTGNTLFKRGFPQLVPSDQIDLTLMDLTHDCNDTCVGSITVQALSGCLPISYQWNDTAMQTTATAVGLCAGTYTVVATDNCGCTNTLTDIIEGHTVEFIDIDVTNTCLGGTQGAIDITVSGNYPPLGYSWSTGATTEDLQGLWADTYSVTVMDTYGCSKTMSADVMAIETVEVDIEFKPSCLKNPDGAVWASASGGESPYSFLWSNGATQDSLYNIMAGLYFLTVTDQNGCIGIDSVTVAYHDSSIVQEIIQHVSCYGGSSGSIDITITPYPPYTFLWSNGATTEDIQHLPGGQYYVDYFDNVGCHGSDTFLVKDELLIDKIIYTDSICGCFGTAEYIGPPGLLQWSNGDTTNIATGLCPDTLYSLIYHDTAYNCYDSALFMITYEPANIPIAYESTDYCDNTNEITAFPDSSYWPYDFTWADIDQSIYLGQTVTGLYPGFYWLTVTSQDYSTCYDTGFYYLYAPTTLQIDITDTVSPTCSNINNGSISVLPVETANPPFFLPDYPYSVDIYHNTTFVGGAWHQLGSPYVADTFTNLETGWYIIILNDGCVVIDSIYLEPEYEFKYKVAAYPYCSYFDQGYAYVTNLTGASPYTYLWSTGATSNGINSIPAGMYSVTVVDSNNCQKAHDFSIDYRFDFNTSVINEFCDNGCNGQIQVEVNNPTGLLYDYRLYLNNNLVEYCLDCDTIIIFDSLCPGVYDVEVINPDDCESYDSLIYVLEADSFYLNPDIIANNCVESNDYTIDLNVTGTATPFSYAWSTGAITNPLNVTSDGTYQVTVSDSNGCTITASIDVEPVMETGFTTTNPTCVEFSNGSATVTAINGLSPYEYSWSNGETTSSISGLGLGIYVCTITDQYGCPIIEEVELTADDVLALDIDAAPPTCMDANGDSLLGYIDLTIVNGQSPFSINWNTGDTIPYLDSLLTGIYTLTVSGNDGCTVHDTIDISIPSLRVHFDARGEGCDGLPNTLHSGDGILSVEIVGGQSPYFYLWENSTTNDSLLGLIDYEYHTITVTDANGCIAVDSSFTISEQTITLPSGWSIWSTYIDVEEDFGDFFIRIGIDTLIDIMKNGIGQVYWPAYTLDVIDNFETNEGYQAKMFYPASFTTEGTILCPEDNPIDLAEGWGLYSYLRKDTMNTLDVFASIADSVIIVKNGTGAVCWPQYNLNMIGSMQPGEGYQVNMANSEILTYTANDPGYGTKTTTNLAPIHLLPNDSAIRTDQFMVLGIPYESWGVPPQVGDLIKVFGENGQLVGLSAFLGDFSAVVLYGDDTTTPNIEEGLAEDESFSITTVAQGSKAVRHLKVDNWQQGNGLFLHEELCVVGSKAQLNTVVDTSPELLLELYPNPGTGRFMMELYSSIACKVSLEVFNQNGMLLYVEQQLELGEGWQKEILSLEHLPSGAYTLRVISDQTVAYKKLLIIK